MLTPLHHYQARRHILYTDLTDHNKDKNNEGVGLTLELIYIALGPTTGLSPEQMEKVNVYLEHHGHQRDASPSLKRKELSPNADLPKRKDSKPKERIREFLSGKGH